MIALAKLLITFAIVGGAAAAVRALARKGAALRKSAAGPAEAPAGASAIDLDRCPVCGVYVPAAAGACGQAGCPRDRS
jgi:hypothetical protein